MARKTHLDAHHPILHKDPPNGTLPKTNMAPENGWLEDQISFRIGLFSAAMLVSGSVEEVTCFNL